MERENFRLWRPLARIRVVQTYQPLPIWVPGEAAEGHSAEHLDRLGLGLEEPRSFFPPHLTAEDQPLAVGRPDERSWMNNACENRAGVLLFWIHEVEVPRRI